MDPQGDEGRVERASEARVRVDAGGSSAETVDVQLRVRSLPSANAGVVAVSPNDPIEVACAKMSMRNFSQLAVLSGPRSLKGVISWETIGLQRITSDPRQVQDAMDPRPKVVQLDEPLLPTLPTVGDANFVFVRGRDGTLTGIITAADITEEFRALATPYLVLGEIERQLRQLIERVCTLEEIRDARHDGDDARRVEGAEDLSLGELARLLEAPHIWDRFGWQLDRVTFGHELKEVLRIRNGLMHFSEERLSDADRWTLESSARFLSRLI